MGALAREHLRDTVQPVSKRERASVSGAYRSLLIEDSAALARAGDYIHLNPIRAYVVGPKEISRYRWSSLFRFCSDEERPPWLQGYNLLKPHGCRDHLAGWAVYLGNLAEIAMSEDVQKRLEFDRMSIGWAIGTAGWRKAVAQELSQRALAVGLSESERREQKEAMWTAILARELNRWRWKFSDVANSPASALWKREVALVLRKEGGAPYRWVTERLEIGSPATARVAVHRSSRECNL